MNETNDLDLHGIDPALDLFLDTGSALADQNEAVGLERNATSFTDDSPEFFQNLGLHLYAVGDLHIILDKHRALRGGEHTGAINVCYDSNTLLDIVLVCYIIARRY